MAKTKQDYFDAGAAAAITNSRDVPARITNPCKEGSWQFSAWQDGYDAEADKHATESQDRTCEPTVTPESIAELQKRPFVAAAGGFQVPRAVLKHCNQLQAIADTSGDPVRAARCVRKIETILGKWGKRAHAHQLRAGL